MQTGFHDGRSTLAEVKAKIGDTCVMQIPESENFRCNKIRVRLSRISNKRN